MSSYIEIFFNQTREFVWHAKSANNRILCTPGESFHTRGGCLHNVYCMASLFNGHLPRIIDHTKGGEVLNIPDNTPIGLFEREDLIAFGNWLLQNFGGAIVTDEDLQKWMADTAEH